MTMRKVRLLATLVLVVLSVAAVPSTFVRKAKAVCTDCAPPPPPPPTVGEFGGPLAGLTTNLTNLFNGGYDTFAIKWDPIRGLGPVSTRTGCFTCHGTGVDVVVAGTAGNTSNITGTRFGKFNSDGTFNYLDGTGADTADMENEGGPILHGVSNNAFGTLPGCDVAPIVSSPTGATESGTKVTITTTAAHLYSAGQTAMISGVGVSGYNGTFTIASVPSSTTLTYTATKSGLKASGGGQAQNLPPEVVPADATTVSQVRSPNLYGLGLIDNIPDSAILANSGVGKGLGITGVANMVADENGTIRPGRFGQKLNVVTLFEFTAQAEFNELGITSTNSLFGTSSAFFPSEHLPQGKAYPSACQPDTNSPQDIKQANMIKMTQFEALLAPIPPQKATSTTSAGLGVFNSIGCSLCHMESFTTQSKVTLRTTNGKQSGTVTPLSNVTFNPYSDFLLHDMGSGDSGGIPFQPGNTGQATLTMWRTSPLWGLSNTLATAGGLMHDNASTTLDAAIRRHGGEASTVVSSYKSLSSTDSSDLLAFLGSL